MSRAYPQILDGSLLSYVPLSFYHLEMENERIAAAIAEAPAWAKIGLTMPSEKMRERSALELANHIAETLDKPFAIVDRNQLPLPL